MLINDLIAKLLSFTEQAKHREEEEEVKTLF